MDHLIAGLMKRYLKLATTVEQILKNPGQVIDYPREMVFGTRLFREIRANIPCRMDPVILLF